MKKLLSVSTIIVMIVQSVVLCFFFTGELSKYPINTVDIIWIGSACLGILCGILFFKINKDIKVPSLTVPIIALLGVLVFILALFKYWIIIVLLILAAVGLHFYTYRNNKFTIIPVVSSVMGIYSIMLLLLMIGITSM